jgi:SAM-dependent methyltransferase
MARLSERLRGRRSQGANELTRELPVGRLGDEESSVSRLLYERLGPHELAEIERRAREAPELQGLPLDTGDPVLKRQLTLHYGMWLEIPEVGKQTGLRPDQPPEDVHAMARGPMAAAGALYEADLIADGLQATGTRIDDIERGLDFGCSSGRVVRVLQAAFPATRWVGCDANERAIGWAREHLPGIEFFASGGEPPLALMPESLDLAFAISIWSHFEPRLGLRWLDEMRRVLRSGGKLVFTTHGPTSVAYFAEHGVRGPQQSHEIRDALYRRGWWYRNEFGDEGDWGVVDPGWGTAFVTPEWLVSQLTPQWHLLEFAPARNAGNQDVYVLERP